jgi:hypothetical protein
MCTLTGWMLLRKDMLSSLSLSDSCPKLFDRSRGSTNIAGPRQRSGALAAPTISQALSHHHHRHRRGNRRLIDTCPLSRKVQSAMSGTRSRIQHGRVAILPRDKFHPRSGHFSGCVHQVYTVPKEVIPHAEGSQGNSLHTLSAPDLKI